MEVVSDDKKLLKQASDDTVAKKELGAEQAKKLGMRVAELKSVDTIEELLAGTGRWELLLQNRAGTYSGRLNGNCRLIVKFELEDSEGDEEHVNVVHACLLEIVDYHEKKNKR
ncbi:type II toxin-antitoxin system RelE/ParE family toxin [Arthrobacter sp. S41]|uniref:type II toxin-antitoxin system RelE/ParE family toxin n=1 Tax=Arthrobacter sp. S41 TaxID=2509721 RepID=UPI0010362753|nr:type II toxin-antitoxin system RelE/ParE family toxin [Arthrobacter sp. S41]TAP26880.1 plasmid maintenance system killer protein [Arthrobacter sp. S41]